TPRRALAFSTRRPGDAHSGCGERQESRDRQNLSGGLAHETSKGPHRVHHARPRRRGARASGLQGHSAKRLEVGGGEMTTIRLTSLRRHDGLLSTPFHKDDHLCCAAFGFCRGATREHSRQRSVTEEQLSQKPNETQSSGRLFV